MATALLGEGLEGWLKESTAGQKGNILVHTKLVVVDFTSGIELMRLYDHYRFRWYLATHSGHAVVAVGYDDGKKIGKDKGALLIRKSWGTEWGEKGYGWLPYSYLKSGLADDFWTMVKAEYVETDLFK